MICTANQLTGFYMRATLAFIRLKKSERIFRLLKSSVNDLYGFGCAGEQAKPKNEEESDDGEEIDIKLGEENATNGNKENVIEID